MASMSCFDIIASISIGLATIPMPADSIYDFAGPMLGNTVTCQIQGFLQIFGIVGSASVYMSLCWYYVCKLTFGMTSRNIKNIVEPIMATYTIVLACAIPAYFLSRNLIHSLPYESFCTLANIPNERGDCAEIENPWSACENNRQEWIENFDKYNDSLNIVVYTVGANMMLIFLAMFIILWTAYKNYKEAKKRESLIQDTQQDPISDAAEVSEKQDSELLFTRVLVTQALMYIFVYLLTWVFMVIPMMIPQGAMMLPQGTLTKIFNICRSVFFPLSGFWNLIIFLYDKVQLVILSTNNKNVWQAIKTVVLSPADVPVLILTDLPVFQKHDEESSFNEGGSGPSTNPSAAIDLSFAKDSHEDDSRLSQYDGISFDKPMSTTSQEVSNKMDISLARESQKSKSSLSPQEANGLIIDDCPDSFKRSSQLRFNHN
eukprot:scaffold10180_cov304-Chaetoceros_neogracile.AAC.11